MGMHFGLIAAKTRPGHQRIRLMKKSYIAVVLSFVAATAASEEPASVGFCASSPCCRYEASSCSEGNTSALIARSRIASGQEQFCAKLRSSQWTYLPLNVDHEVTREEANEYFPLRGAQTEIAPKAGHFDIDNDGKPEYLAWLSAYSGAGQGCDVEQFAELDQERAHIKRGALSDLLSYDSCSTYNRAFEYEGKTFIENRMTIRFDGIRDILPHVLTEVFILEGGARRSVCTFELAGYTGSEDE
jgi:hypothetical protein